jgi:serine/threonine protein kinase
MVSGSSELPPPGPRAEGYPASAAESATVRIDQRGAAPFASDTPFLSLPTFEQLTHLGPYRFRRRLAEGGMGLVYEAEDVALNRVVALKVIRPEFACTLEARERFFREARALAAVRSDHVVSVYQAGEENGLLFLAMELLAGESLEARLRRDGKLSPADACNLGRQVAEGLAAAHQCGLVHRDVKPDNIWLPVRGTSSSLGTIKLIDFGLARPVHDDAQLTRPGLVLGTPAYMAPEQADGTQTNERSDLYSLGCVLYRAVTGQLPFDGRSTLALLRALAVSKVTPIEVVEPSVPEPLAEAITRLLDRDPARRPESAAQVAVWMRLIEAGHPPPMLVRAPGRSRRLVAAVALLAMVALLGIRIKHHQLSDHLEPRAVGAAALRRDTISEVLLARAGQGDVERAPAELVAVLSANVDAQPGAAVLALAVSPDGQLAASGGDDHVVHLWDLTTGKLLRDLGGHPSEIRGLAFSEDGRLVSYSADGMLKLWDTQSGACMSTQVLPALNAWNIALSSDARWLVVGGDSRAVLSIDLPNRIFLQSKDHENSVFRVALSPEGRRAASASGDGSAVIWDIQTGEPLTTLKGHEDFVDSVTFSPDGRTLATAGKDGAVRLWDADSGQAQAILTGHAPGQAICGLVYRPDGRALASSGCDSTVRLWTLGKESRSRTLVRFPERHSVMSVAFTPDGRHLLTANHDGTVYVLRLQSEED